MRLFTLNDYTIYPVSRARVVSYLHSDIEPGLSEYAVEAWERQTLKPKGEDMLVKGQHVKGRRDRPFIVYIHPVLWWRWFDPCPLTSRR